MANEASKDFNAMLQDSKGMPKIQTITDEKEHREIRREPNVLCACRSTMTA